MMNCVLFFLFVSVSCKLSVASHFQSFDLLRKLYAHAFFNVYSSCFVWYSLFQMEESFSSKVESVIEDYSFMDYISPSLLLSGAGILLFFLLLAIFGNETVVFNTYT